MDMILKSMRFVLHEKKGGHNLVHMHSIVEKLIFQAIKIPANPMHNICVVEIVRIHEAERHFLLNSLIFFGDL